jgi:hypothetical protein
MRLYKAEKGNDDEDDFGLLKQDMTPGKKLFHAQKLVFFL